MIIITTCVLKSILALKIFQYLNEVTMLHILKGLKTCENIILHFQILTIQNDCDEICYYVWSKRRVTITPEKAGMLNCTQSSLFHQLIKAGNVSKVNEKVIAKT